MTPPTAASATIDNALGSGTSGTLAQALPVDAEKASSAAIIVFVGFTVICPTLLKPNSERFLHVVEGDTSKK